ncbi:hypothetical protein SAMN04488511_113128 [Pedobacter suwonensis]|uniref:Uncharacterized protein n=1 Tax=Pedobacter suwonensis TaxID=332999 RepID=A0A1I0TRL3_9SPHI|nr:hypothetical protein SAMN04488511_113128 [Pedobacter suwonensis]
MDLIVTTVNVFLPDNNLHHRIFSELPGVIPVVVQVAEKKAW